MVGCNPALRLAAKAFGVSGLVVTYDGCVWGYDEHGYK